MSHSRSQSSFYVTVTCFPGSRCMNDLNQKARKILHLTIHDSYYNFKDRKKTDTNNRWSKSYCVDFMYNCTKHKSIIEMASRKKWSTKSKIILNEFLVSEFHLLGQKSEYSAL